MNRENKIMYGNDPRLQNVRKLKGYIYESMVCGYTRHVVGPAIGSFNAARNTCFSIVHFHAEGLTPPIPNLIGVRLLVASSLRDIEAVEIKPLLAFNWFSCVQGFILVVVASA